MKSSRLAIAGAAAVAAAAVVAAAPAPSRPVYVLLVSTIEDHLNTELSEERLERTLPLVERYRRQYPAYHVSCLVEFNGAVAESLADRRANGLVDRLRTLAAAHVVEIGYNGADEPTPTARPRPNLRSARTPEARWEARLEATDWFVHEHKHFVNGEPDPSRPGGLARVREVFGPVAAASGVSLDVAADSEFVHLLRQDGAGLLLPGFTDAATFPARLLNGYRGATFTASSMLAVSPDTPPELFWQDGQLRFSEYVGPATRVAALAAEGPDGLRGVFEALPSDRPHVVRVRLAPPTLYTKVPFGKRNYSSPLEYAYDNPKDYRLPADAVLPRPEIDANYAREDAAVRWLVEQYFPAHPGSRFVSVAELQSLAAPAATPGGDVVLEAARRLVADWPGALPPPFVEVGDEYYSLAEVFGLLVTRLGDRDAPRAVTGLFGPLAMPTSESVAPRTVRVESVARAASQLAARYRDTAWSRVPTRVVPSEIVVDGGRMNAAEFLRAMADALTSPTADGAVRVVPRSMHSRLGEGFPHSRPRDEMGTTWTVKPARLRVAMAATASAR